MSVLSPTRTNSRLWSGPPKKVEVGGSVSHPVQVLKVSTCHQMSSVSRLSAARSRFSRHEGGKAAGAVTAGFSAAFPRTQSPASANRPRRPAHGEEPALESRLNASCGAFAITEWTFYARGAASWEDVFRGRSAAFDFAFARLSCASPCALHARRRAFEGERRQSRPGSVLATLASLLGQGVFWQMDVLQTIIDQGHPD